MSDIKSDLSSDELIELNEGYEKWRLYNFIHMLDYSPFFKYPKYYLDTNVQYTKDISFYHTVIRYVNPKTKNISLSDLINKFKSFRNQLHKKGIYEIVSYVFEKSDNNQLHLHVLYAYNNKRYNYKTIKIPKYEVFTTKINDKTHFQNTLEYFKKTLN